MSLGSLQLIKTLFRMCKTTSLPERPLQKDNCPTFLRFFCKEKDGTNRLILLIVVDDDNSCHNTKHAIFS